MGKVADTCMVCMFAGAAVFNQNIDAWQTGKVADTCMVYMFAGAAVFNQPLTSWQTSSVSSMECMFYTAMCTG